MTIGATASLFQSGFVRVPGLLPVAEVAYWRRIAQEVLDDLDASHRERFRSNGSLCNLAELPAFAPLIADRRITSAIGDVGGRDVRWTAGYLISKLPGGEPLFWHQDWWGWSDPISYEPAPAQLFVMIYLTGTSIENGCLRVIPGSHRRDHPLHDLPAAHTQELATAIDTSSPAYASHADEVAVPVDAGDVLIGDSRLLHGAYANSTDRERPLLTLWYIPDWSGLPAAIQAALQTIYERRVVDIDECTEAQPTPEDWPAASLAKIEHLLPRYEGSARPAAWNRQPDRERLMQVGQSQ